MDQVHLYRDVLHWCFESNGVEPSARQIQQAIRNASAIEGADLLQDGHEWLEMFGRPLGLRFLPVPSSVESLRRGERVFPLLRRLEREDGTGEWIGIRGRERGRYRVIRLGGEYEGEFWATEKELREWLRLAPGEPTDWLTVELMAPLTSWQRKKEDSDAPQGTWARLWPRIMGLVRSERGELWTIIIYAIAIGVMSLVTPITVQALVNTVAFGTLFQPLLVLSLMLAVGLIFTAVMQAIQTYIAEMINRRVFVRVVADFAYRLSRAKQSALNKYNRSELSNYFFDVLTVQKVLAVLLLDALAGVLSILSGLLLLAVYHPVLLAFDTLLLLSIMFLIFILGRGAVASSIEESKKKHKTAAWLDQLAHQNVLYKSHGGVDLALSQADVFSRQYLQARKKHFRIVMRQLLTGLAIQVVASAGLLLVGGWLVISQQLTLGQLVASELVVSVLVASLFKVTKSFEKFYDLLASLDKLGKVVDLELERGDGIPLPPASAPASLQLANLGHKTAAGRPLFENISLSVSPGQSMAVCGLEGVGRSVLSSMLFGMQTPHTGQIYLDEHLIQDVRLEDVRRVVSLVRSVELIDGDLLDNIQLERTDVSRWSVRRALEISGLLPYVLTLPDGLHTKLKDACLSAQQEKQLMLARALAGRPGLIVIDGLLDQFDEMTLANVFTQFANHKDELPTLLLLTNRKQVVESADRRFVLNVHDSSVVPLERTAFLGNG